MIIIKVLIRSISIPLRNLFFFTTFLPLVLMADDRTAVETLSVFGKKESLPTRPGSAHVVNQEDLDRFDFNDVHRVLRSVPGVNIQEEDGFGLRPNIGLRGGHPHRSKKVAIMEDGVLIGPAPYSAPAAYYFPQLDKIASIEVFKGTPSTKFGPNSIGGAINLVSRMNQPGLKLGYSLGSFDFNKYDLSAGIETFGDISLDISRVETTGFKKLLNKDNTGFIRNNFTFRWDKYFVKMDQNINFKFNWSDEVSNETYAGLTQQDFNQDPFQRYSATELDKMTWQHRQLFLSYALTPAENLRTRLTLYHHNFDRSWNKLNGFAGTDPDNNPSVSIREVLKKPELAVNNQYYRVLRGEADSQLSDDRDVLDLGNNQRQYYSQGAQLNFDYELDGYLLEHNFSFYLRAHQDGISRFHESTYYNMTAGRLVLNNSRAAETTLLNEGSAEALTTALTYETSWQNLRINGVLRSEQVNYEQKNRSTNLVQETTNNFLAPGLGLYYGFLPDMGLIAGVNKAFTPTGPGQAPSIKPEEAINYELGLRYTGRVGLELIGFYSDYQNLLGTCTQSGGCLVNQLDQSFNGGKAEVLGAEFLLHSDFKTQAMTFPFRLTATYTQAQFKNAFASTLSDWGDGNIVVGDPIPYIPEWQANLMAGLEWKKLSAYLNIHYLGEMADQAVAVDNFGNNREFISSRVVMNLSVGYKFYRELSLKLRVDNLSNETYVVSQRPFGLRPGRPQAFILGVQGEFW